MNNVKRQVFGERKCAGTAGAAVLLGAAIGLAAGGITVFLLPRDFSFTARLILVLSTSAFVGIWGYFAWLCTDRVRGERLLTLTRFLASATILTVLVVWPDFWRQMARGFGLVFLWVIMGFMFSMTLFAVTAAWGLVHLVTYAATWSRDATKHGSDSQRNVLWDGDLDCA